MGLRPACGEGSPLAVLRQMDLERRGHWCTGRAPRTGGLSLFVSFKTLLYVVQTLTNSHFWWGRPRDFINDACCKVRCTRSPPCATGDSTGILQCAIVHALKTDAVASPMPSAQNRLRTPAPIVGYGVILMRPPGLCRFPLPHGPNRRRIAHSRRFRTPASMMQAASSGIPSPR